MGFTKKTIIWLLLVFIGSILPGTAETLYVPKDFPSIQTAVDASSDGDTIVVFPGTYMENVVIDTKSITLNSRDGAASTWIDGGQKGSVVTFVSTKGRESDGSVLKGFTITNGAAGLGGGIYTNSNVLITKNIVRHNTADRGAGLYLLSLWGDPKIQKIESNDLIANSATRGGGIFSFSQSKITGNSISGNMASHSGAGVCLHDGDASILEANTIWENLSSGWGGGVMCNHGSPHIWNNDIRANGAVQGGGVYCGSHSETVLEGNHISMNHASQRGGGVQCYLTSDAILRNNIIVQNTADEGGGICFVNSAPKEFNHNTVVDNTAISLGGGIFQIQMIPTLRNSIFWGNIPTQVDGNTSTKAWIWYSNVQGGFTGTGNIDADPCFVDPDEGDHHLRFDSPCRDAGDIWKYLPFDFEGDPRAFPDTPDMGADEFHPHLYAMGSAVPGGEARIRIIGLPASPTTLYLGQGLLLEPRKTMFGDWYLVPPVTAFALGAVPLKGVIEIEVRIPSGFPAPFEIPLQSLVREKLTNPLVMKVKL
jgi:parallel beta-helix repeat protein